MPDADDGSKKFLANVVVNSSGALIHSLTRSDWCLNQCLRKPFDDVLKGLDCCDPCSQSTFTGTERGARQPWILPVNQEALYTVDANVKDITSWPRGSSIESQRGLLVSISIFFKDDQLCS